MFFFELFSRYFLDAVETDKIVIACHIHSADHVINSVFSILWCNDCWNLYRKLMKCLEIWLIFSTSIKETEKDKLRFHMQSIWILSFYLHYSLVYLHLSSSFTEIGMNHDLFTTIVLDLSRKFARLLTAASLVLNLLSRFKESKLHPWYRSMMMMSWLLLTLFFLLVKLQLVPSCVLSFPSSIFLFLSHRMCVFVTQVWIYCSSRCPLCWSHSLSFFSVHLFFLLFFLYQPPSQSFIISFWYFL